MATAASPAFRALLTRSPWLLGRASNAMATPSTSSSSKRPSSDMAAFKEHLRSARRVVALTGAGISAESGVPTFRGAGGLWRRHRAQDLASPAAFDADPALVWEFYHYRRELVLTKRPNAAHAALAALQRRMEARGGACVVVTQNVDELHRRAGTRDLVELHGSLFRVRCTACGRETANRDSPVCPALAGRGEPDADAADRAAADPVPVSDLPHCDCGRNGLLRPAVVWFGEMLDPAVTERAMEEVRQCDVCLVVGTSSVVYPAAGYAPVAAASGAVVAEFNMEETEVTGKFSFHFQGPCATTLPQALDID